MSFVAKRPGRCGECGDRVEEGEVVCYVDDVLVHLDCEGSAIAAEGRVVDPPTLGRPAKPEPRHPGNPPQTFL